MSDQVKMNIPKGMLSASQFRTFGAAGLLLDEQEDDIGCPRLYQAKYIERTLPPEERSYPLNYGSYFHRILFLIEQGETPDDALQSAIEPDVSLEMVAEARVDLENYMVRGAPSDRYGTLAVESELSAVLYVDEVFGPISFRGFIDWIGVDLDLPNVLHVTDYKTNRFPPNEADLMGDIQMRGYHWLVWKNRARWSDSESVKIITHYDAIKFREVSLQYTDQQIQDWETWAIAVARQILREEKFEPVINAGCSHCPIRRDCPAYQSLPESADLLIAQRPEALDDLMVWRDRANAIRLTLEKEVKAIDGKMKDVAMSSSDVVVPIGGYTLEIVPNVVETADMRRLHTVLQDEFYDVISTSKAAIERLAGTDRPTLRTAALNCYEPEIKGTKVRKLKTKAPKAQPKQLGE